MELLRSRGSTDQDHEIGIGKEIGNVCRANRALAFLRLSFVLFFAFFAGVPVQASQGSTPPLNQVIDSVPAAREFGDVAISPNGHYVAWTSGSDIMVKDLMNTTSQPQRLARGGDIAWSPDSRRLAFLSDAGEHGQLQLYTLDARGDAPRRWTNLKGALANPQWSPDGKTLAFLFVKDAPRKPGAMEAMTPLVGVVREQSFEQVVALVDLTSGRVRLLSASDLYVYEYDWSPDGKEFVATGAHGPGDDNHYVAQLYGISVDTGKETLILKPNLQITAPRWSPDGKQIAFIGGLMAGFGGGNCGDVYVISAHGGPARNVTPQMKASARGPLGLRWASTDRIIFGEYVHGQGGLTEIDLTHGKIEPLWRGTEFSAQGGEMEAFSLTGDGRTSALVLKSFDRPPEIWVGPIGAWTQITKINQNLHPTWGRVESIDWTSDGWPTQGWLYYPANYDPHKRYPMVVNVHGGPTAAVTPAWGGENATLSIEDYFVLLPNYLGSAGEGEAFMNAIVRDVGYGDLRSILAGVNKVTAALPIDKQRIGITGWSYGGLMTMWAVTQTDLFHAAVSGAGISDWLSYVGEADIPKWVNAYFGGALVYEDPALYARSSPMNYIRHVKTPVLIIVGQYDGECPFAQSVEFWGALRILGVRSELVIYPDEGHDFRKPEDGRDVTRRRIEWFNEYLK